MFSFFCFVLGTWAADMAKAGRTVHIFKSALYFHFNRALASEKLWLALCQSDFQFPHFFCLRRNEVFVWEFVARIALWKSFFLKILWLSLLRFSLIWEFVAGIALFQCHFFLWEFVADDFENFWQVSSCASSFLCCRHSCHVVPCPLSWLPGFIFFCCFLPLCAVALLVLWFPVRFRFFCGLFFFCTILFSVYTKSYVQAFSFFQLSFFWFFLLSLLYTHCRWQFPVEMPHLLTTRKH